MACGLLFGCESLPKTPTWMEREPTEQVQAEPGLSPKRRFTKAVTHLERGEDADARAELIELLRVMPHHPSAEKLLDQIETPVGEYFPPQYTVVPLGSGESLSTVARTYLGDPLLFYALARYNDIAEPSRVPADIKLKIPHTAQSLAAFDAARQPAKPTTTRKSRRPEKKVAANPVVMPDSTAPAPAANAPATITPDNDPDIEQEIRKALASGNVSSAVDRLKTL